MKEFIKKLSPAWFTCVMGTGITSIVSGFYLPFLKAPLFYISCAFFFSFFALWIIRWIFFFKEALEDLKDPIVSNFYPTAGVGALVLAAAASNYSFKLWMWILGAAITVFFSVVSPLMFFTRRSIEIKSVNPAWFIPPVGLVVVPIAGSQVASMMEGPQRGLVFFVNIACWGAGFLLYLALHAVVLQRMIFHEPLPSKLIPTLWINLGPIGAGGMGIINLTGVFRPDLVHIVKFACLLIWGLGVWWFVIALSMTLMNIRMDFAMSWWAFTFPLGAYVALCRSLSSEMEYLNTFGAFLYALLLIFWVITFSRTLRELLRGNPRF